VCAHVNSDGQVHPRCLGGGALGIGIRETSPGAVCCSEWQCGAA